MGKRANYGRGALPGMEEMEAFGAAGEEAAYRVLREAFSTVIRNPVVPHKEKFLEKDFLVVESGVPFVIEVKNWKGSVSMEGDRFRQTKPDGTVKELKNPVGTTAQFVREMGQYYGLECDLYGVVVFLDPDCVLNLPESLEGIALLPMKKLVSYIRATAKRAGNTTFPDASSILRCTRLYSDEREFCKGILVDRYLSCKDRKGKKVSLDTTKLKYVTVQRRPLFLGYRLLVTFSNNATVIFFVKNQRIVVGCLDGTFCRFSLGKLRHMVF